jgi:hypothetical protein
MKRSTFTIYEEFRLIDKLVLDAVIRPFSYIRPAPYLKNKEYEEFIEEPKEVFISSAYHKGLWWYEETRKAVIDMLAGKSSGFIAFDTSVAIKHKIKTLAKINSEKSKMDEITAMEEYDNIPWGENSDAYFRLSMFEKARKLEKAVYPQRPENYNQKKNPYNIPRTDGEIRILSCDIATMGGRVNDQSVTSFLRLIPTRKGYRRELLYMESFLGKGAVPQSLRIKRLFYDLDIDVIVLDVQNAGGPVYEMLGLLTKDNERDIEYPPLTIMRHPSIDEDTYKKWSEKTYDINALPVIYPISATLALNSEIAVEMRDKLQKKMFEFLVDDTKAEDYQIRTNPEFIKDNSDSAFRAAILHPHVQTNLFINECVNLSYDFIRGNVKLQELSGNRKDRYSSVAYGNYYASLLDKDLIKKYVPTDDWEVLQSVTFFG